MAGDATLKLVQAKINSLGYAPALVTDGIIGDKTRAAISWARTRFGLGPGSLDAALLGKLGISAAPSIAPAPGSSGIAGLQPAVVAALPSIFGKWEGRSVPWMYLDEKGYVTCATGSLIDPIANALLLGWMKPDGSLASVSEITSAWSAVDSLRSDPKGKKQTSGPATKGGYASEFQKASALRLPQAAMDRLTLSTVARNQAYFMSKYAGFQNWPADAQLAMHSLAWAWGAGFSKVWGALGASFDAAVNKGDFVTAAAIMKQASTHEESINPGIVPRDIGTEAMFQNAASVLSTGKNVAQLFYPATAGALMGLGLVGKMLPSLGGIGVTDLGFVVGGMIVGGMFLGAPGALIGGVIGAGLDFARRKGLK